MIHTPIAMPHLRKRAQGSYYKDVAQYRAEWKLLFDNARTYNVEGSLVYIDADIHDGESLDRDILEVEQ